MSTRIRNQRFRLIGATLLTLAAVRQASALDQGRMECRYPDGSAQILAIDGAKESRGAVVYRVGSDRVWTTRACLFNIGPGSEESQKAVFEIGPSLVTCDGPDRLPIYTEFAAKASIRNGIVIWEEQATGDRYLSTAPCLVEPQ